MRTKLVAAWVLSLACVSAPAAAKEYTVHAKGRLLFTDGDGSHKPVVGARVRLMDSDSDDDETMAYGKTDENGYYDLTGKAGDSFTLCDGCDHPDPYIKFVLWEDHRIDVHNIWGSTHFGLTDTKEDTAGNVYFGEREFESDEALYPLLFAYAQTQYRRFTERTGDSAIPRNDGMVEVQVPEVIEGGTPWTAVGAIHWPGDFTRWTAFAHEFGHRIRHAADGDEPHFLGDSIRFQYARSHSQTDLTNLGFAFNEGWAEYYSSVMGGDDEGWVPGWDVSAYKGKPQENEYEGQVAAKLWHLGRACGGIKSMWAALKAGEGQSISGGPAGAYDGIHSFNQFHTWFKQKNPSCVEVIKNSVLSNAVLKGIFDKHTASAVSIAAQNAAIKKSSDAIDKRATRPMRVKWTAARLAKLPVAIQAPMKRIHDKRAAHAAAHDANVRAAFRTALQSLKPATRQSLADGSHERDMRVLRASLLKASGEPRMRQLAEQRQDLLREKAGSTDAGFRAYVDHLLARIAQQESEIRTAMAAPNPRFPEVLQPRSFGAQTVASKP